MYSSIWPSFILALITVIGVSYLSTQDTVNGWIVFVFGATVLSGIYSILRLAEWGGEVWAEWYLKKRSADAITPESKFAEQQIGLAKELKELDDDRVKLLGAQTLLGIDVGMDAEQYVRGTNVPLWFAYEFLTKCNDQYLAARSSFGGIETTEYRFADELTRFFVRFGYVDDPHDNRQWTGGNQPARWTRSGLRDRLLHLWFDEEYLTDIPNGGNGRDLGYIPPSPTASTGQNRAN